MAKNAPLCAPFATLLRQLFGSCRQGAGRNGKRPETYLTPYEMEMVPLMLKELDDLDHRFYQMVCYRWFKEASHWPSSTVTAATSAEEDFSIAETVSRSASTCGAPLHNGFHNNNGTNNNTSTNNNGNALCVGAGASTTTISTTSSSTTTRPNNRSMTPTFEDFVNEGLALRHLIRILSRTLRDTGAFDDKCEAALAAYRTRRQQWQAAAAVAPATVASRVRSYSALTVVATTAATNDGFVKSIGATPIVLLNNEPSDDAAEPSRAIQRRRPATTIVDSRPPALSTIPAPVPAIIEPTPPTVASPTKSKPSSKRTQRKQRQRDASASDALFVQLGDILRHQFHTTVTVGERKSGLPSETQRPDRQENADENVHERELKVLIWKHFVQMLVAILNDRDRFPA